MGPVRAEQDPVSSDRLDQLRHVVLEERRHPEVPLELLHRIAAERARDLDMGGSQLVQQRLHPPGSRLDGRDPQVGVTLEELVGEERGDAVAYRRG